MEEPAAEKRLDVCHRCLQPVPAKAARCPHCGDPMSHTVNMPLMLGMFGVLILILLAFFTLRLMHSGGAAPPPADADQQQPGAPHSDPPPEPQPKPALGQ
jgi:heme/copper-type cytochrome/quinol oxidase subunit 2